MKAAIIGAGHISRQHLACLREMPGVEIAGICDISRTVAEAAADRFSVPAWYTGHQAMLRDVKPDVVHITTPPSSHLVLARDALDSGAHVIVEKPATLLYEDTAALLELARAKELVLVEDYNYLFNSQVRELLGFIETGALGTVVRFEAFICLPITAPGSPYLDMNVPHPFLGLPGGAIADFLPHLASLAHLFVGEHRSIRSAWSKRCPGHPLPSDEFHALVEAERGTAILGFSAHAQPDAFYIRVDGTKMRASANLFETRLTSERVRGGPKPLTPVLNGISEARQMRRTAFSGLWRKLSGGPGAYDGLWELLRRTYAALEAGAAPPVTAAQIEQVNRLVRDLTNEDFSL